MDQQLLAFYSFVRERTLKMLDATSEEMADVVPQGFNNSIRWNFGHILTSQESLLVGYGLGETLGLPLELIDLFKGGTKPADWGTKPPTLAELRTLLESQQVRLKEALSGKFDQNSAQSFTLGSFEIKTLTDMFNFTVWHEGLHQGTINAIKSAQGVADFWTPQSEKTNV